MSTSTDFVALERRCLESARRSVNWLLARQAADGSWKGLPNAPVDAYYKAGWAFGLLGEPAAAERVLDYVKKNLLQPNGDFLPRGDAWSIDVHYQYANAWLTIGSQKLGRYDIAAPAAQFLLTQQDPDHGGFYAQKGSAGQKMRSDTMSSGIAGIACLATGQMAAARKLATCFERIIEMQPKPQSKFYLTIEANGKLGTQFPDDQAVWRVVDTQQKDQTWYAVGLPFTFSLLLHQATGEERYAKLSQWYFDFMSRCINPWDGGSSGKAGWGCSMLYRITGDPRYREIALRVAQNQMNCQGADGSFRWGAPTGYGSAAGAGQAPTNDDFDIVSEFTVWLALIGSNLLARDGA
jgi:hypothetical protein